MAQVRESGMPVTRQVAPGVHLHLLRTPRFATTLCRVVLHRDLGEEATATALLAQILQAATARHRSREALAGALGDLYGASLGLSVGRLGDRQLLAGSLEWPTAHVPRAGGLLARGLRLFGDVWARPLRGRRTPGGGPAPLDGEIVETERRNLGRTLAALRDDKYRYALQRGVALAFAGEPYGLDPMGCEADLDEASPAGLAALHARLLATAPIDVFLVGDVGLREAATAVRRHLLWPRAAGAPARLAPAASTRPARPRPRRVAEVDQVQQGKLVFVWRGRVPPTERSVAAASTLAGVLGGGSFSRLFRVLREEEALCYSADATWNAAKGALFVTTGIDPANEVRVRRRVQRLFREVADGRLDDNALHAFRETASEQTASLADDRAALLGWLLAARSLGTEVSARRHLEALRRTGPADVRRVGRSLAADTTFVLLPATPGAAR